MIRLAEYVKGGPLTFREEMLDHKAGESFMVLWALSDESHVGYITYSLYDGNVYIKMIKVPKYQRQGIATAMAKELQKLHPDAEIVWGTTTNDGHKFLKALPRTFLPNERYDQIVKELQDLQRKERELQDIYDGLFDLYDQDREKAEALRPKVKALDTKYNQIRDRIWDLEKELTPLKNGKWKVNV